MIGMMNSCGVTRNSIGGMMNSDDARHQRPSPVTTDPLLKVFLFSTVVASIIRLVLSLSITKAGPDHVNLVISQTILIGYSDTLETL